MILLEKEKLLFLQVPQTGCTAVGKELIEAYGGRDVGRKHDHLASLPKSIRSELVAYTVVASVRDPLAIEVAGWKKAEKLRAGWNPGHAIDPGTVERAAAASEGVDLHRYLIKRFWRPAIDTWSGDRARCDVILRQANLGEDFESMMIRIGHLQQRPLPARNVTGVDLLVPELPEKWLAYVFGPQRRSIGLDDQLAVLHPLLRSLCLADHKTAAVALNLLGGAWIDPGGSVARWTLRALRMPLAPCHLLVTRRLAHGPLTNEPKRLRGWRRRRSTR